MKKTLLSLLVGFCVSNHAFADDLLQVYMEATENDPATLQSQALKDSAFASIGTSKASLLPQIEFTLTAYKEGNDSETEYNLASLDLSQSLYDGSAWAGYDQAKLVAAQAEASYGATSQELILRTASAYFDVLSAKDDLAFARSEKRAIARQLEQTKQRFEVGLTAITDVHEAQAQYDTSVAAEISAENAVEINLEALREITGTYHTDIKVLNTESFSASPPQPENIVDWMKIADERNLQLAAANIGVDIAKESISIASAGRYPTLSFIASVNSLAGEADDFGTSGRGNVSELGLYLTVPIYYGGSISANVDAAKFDFVERSQERERIHRSVVRSVRSNYNDVNAAISRIKAFEQAVVSAQSALQATEAGFDVGTRTIVDVLDSTRNVFDARRNLSAVRYGYVISMLSLKLAAGTLTVDDITGINAGLIAQSK
jgi:outer membrane protein